ncbi:hypothetical protein [Natrinema sp. DC36]|nr:hypothetical protein [Natrinema sp. DC36]
MDDHVGHASELETSVHLHICPNGIGEPVEGDATVCDDTVANVI